MQRSLTNTHCSKYSPDEVISDQKEYSDKVDLEIGLCRLQHHVRSAQKAKQRLGQKISGNTNDQRHQKENHHKSVQIFLQPLLITHAFLLRQNCKRGTVHAQNQGKNREEHGAGNRYRTQSIRPDQIPNPEGIYKLIRGLKQVREHDRQRKRNHLPQHIPGRKISLFHFYLFGGWYFSIQTEFFS